MKTDIEKLQEETLKVVESCVINEINGDTGHVMEHVTNLLCKDGKLDEDIPWRITDTLQELLALLTNPSVSSILPKNLRPEIGQTLLDMLHFFENIGDPACREAFDLYEVKHTSPDEKRLGQLLSYYGKKLAKRKSKELAYLRAKNTINDHFKGI